MQRFRNRYLSLILVSTLASMPPAPLWAGGAAYPRGDVNQDRFIDQEDVSALVDVLLEKDPLLGASTVSDFNVDGTVDVADVISLEEYDGDWDDDGVGDLEDDYPLDPTRWERSLLENTLDSDGDGYAESIDNYRVDDGAVLPGGTGNDSDGDGLSDDNEAANGTDSLLVDTDRDIWCDGPNDPDGAGPIQAGPDQWPLDPDHDGDGYLDGREVREGTDPNNPASHPGGPPDLKAAQVAGNRAFQAEEERLRAAFREKAAAARKSGRILSADGQAGFSGRGLGFQGPESVGSRFDSVQSDKFSGAFSYSIPIKVPPGRGGFQPDLTLLYRSINGDSWLGKGWDLNPGRIERSTRDGVPKYSNPSAPPAHDGDPLSPLDNPDSYIYKTAAGAMGLVFSGTEEIGEQVCGVYHVEVDPGSFVRFIHRPDPANPAGGGWEAWWKNGKKAWFNRDFSTTDTVIAGPGGKIFSWGVEREEDLYGHAIEYSYQQPTGTNNMYLQKVAYNFVGDQPKVEIIFEIVGRADAASWASYRESYRSGFKIVSDHFLLTITEMVSGRGEVYAGHSDLVRKYGLTYHDLDSTRGRTMACLAGVQEFGEGGAGSFPPITMKYSLSEPGFTVGGYGLPSGGLFPFVADVNGYYGDVGTRIMDLNGDGLTDVVRLDYERVWRASLNTGSGFAETAAGLPSGTFPFIAVSHGVNNDVGTRVIDLNGDGLADVMRLQYDTPFHHAEINTGAQFTAASYGLPSNGVFPFVADVGGYHGGDVGTRIMDLNGDGLSDVVRLDYNRIWRAALNTGSGFTETTAGLPSQTYPLIAVNAGVNNDVGTRIIDLNGDGLADVMRLQYDTPFHSATVNTGAGFVATSYGLPSNGTFPFVADVGGYDGGDVGTRIMDLNGDGLSDVVRLDYNRIWRAALNTGLGFIETTAGLPSGTFPFIAVNAGVNNDVGTRIMDINGDGLSDLVRIQYNWGAYAGIRNPGTPNLLTRIDNGIGGTVDVEYTPSTKSWMKLYDPATGQIEVNDGIPFVLQVVSKITRKGLRANNIDPANPTTPGASSQSYTTLYRYAGGKYLDREFRGFGKVKEIDAQTGNFTVTEFHQDFARRGRVRSERAYVGHRADYRVGGVLDGGTIAPRDEHAPTAGEPRLVSETHNRYRVVIHADDPLHLKTFTDTHSKLGLNDFPRGMTLVTPACTLSKVYEYGGNYTKLPQDLDDSGIVSTARETFHDGRGNLVESVDFGQVELIDPGATLSDLAQPRLDVTFQNRAADPDGRIVNMTGYERRQGTWMDLPITANTAGFYTRDLSTGARETQTVELLAAKRTDYDYRNRPVLETFLLDSGPDPTMRYVYDEYGNVRRAIDARGNATVMTYDAIYHAFAATVVNALGHAEQYVVDPGTGNLLSLTDANGHETTASYDTLGRMTSRTNAKGFQFVSYEYGFWEERGNVYLPNRVRTTLWAPSGERLLGVWSEKHYDGLGREYQSLVLGQRGESDPIRVVAEFSDRGLVWKLSHPHWVSEAGNAHSSYEFLESDDAAVPAGEKTWKRMGLSRTVETRRELSSGVSSSTKAVYETPLATKLIDARGNERRQLKDAFGNLAGVWEPDAAGSVGVLLEPQGRFTRYGWDGLGRLEFIRRHLDKDQYADADPTTNVAYDSLGRMSRVDDPDTGVTLYAYDGNGNLTRSSDARGGAVERQYDALDRLVRLAYPDTASSATVEHIYSYDTGAGSNLVGRLARINSPGCDSAFSYDPDGSLLLKRRVIDGTTYNVLCSYDDADRITQLTYPDGMRLQYGYDPVTQALDRVADPDSGQVWLDDVEMSPFQQAEELALGNGVTRRVEFDWIGRASRLLTDSAAGTLSDLRYAFDSNSNVSRIQELAGPAPQGDVRYQYDVLDRLTKAWGTTMSGEDAGDQNSPRFAYNYDALGRMTSNSRFQNSAYGTYSLEYEYSTNAGSDRPAHAVRGIRFTKAAEAPVYAHRFQYDPAGNLVLSTNEAGAVAGKNDLARSYRWDALGRLESMTTASGTTTFAYDHSNARIRKTGPAGESVTYIGQLVEVSPAGTTKHIFAGRMRIATIQPDGRKLFITTDHVHSSTLITDGSGAVVQRMDYEPYGALIQNARSGNLAGLRHTYTGQEDDAETGLMYYGARYYDPVVGMFASADVLTREPNGPQRFARPDGFVAARTNPQGFNRYAYCGNNPINYEDPTGELVFIPILIGVGIGMVIGGTAAGITSAAQGNTGWELAADIGFGILIGGVAGAVGGWAGGAATSAMLTAGYSATAAGLVGGAAGGAAGGFTSGTLEMAYGAGKAGVMGETYDWRQGLTNLAVSTVVGGALGGAGGALAGRMSNIGGMAKGWRNLPGPALSKANAAQWAEIVSGSMPALPGISADAVGGLVVGIPLPFVLDAVF